MEFPNVWYDITETGAPPAKHNGKSDEVMVAFDDGTIFITHYDYDEKDWRIPWYRPELEDCAILYWRYLPELPFDPSS